MLFRRSSSLVVALCLVVSQTAWAAPPSAPDRERARALMDAGDARFEAKQYASALEQYRAADEIMGVPTTGIEVGRTLERLGLLLEARDVLRKVSEFPQRVDEPKPFSSARQRADRLLGDIAPRIPRVTLEVSGLAEGATAEITWDGKPLDPAKIGGYLEANPGQHHVVGVAAGFPNVTRDLKLAEGQALQVVLAFTTHPATVAAPLAAPTATPSNGAPSAEAPHRPVLLWVGVGVTAAGVAIGSATGVYSLSLTSKAKKFCDGKQCQPDAQQHIDSAKTFANVSNVAFAVGALGAGLVVWQVLAQRNEAPGRDSAQAQVNASFGLGSVELAGTF